MAKNKIWMGQKQQTALMKMTRLRKKPDNKFDDLITRRLRGAHSNVPYDIGRGEMPESLLIDLYNKNKSNPIQRGLFERSFFRVGEKAVTSFEKSLEWHNAAQMWVIRYFKLCSEFQFTCLKPLIKMAVRCISQSETATDRWDLVLPVLEASLSERFCLYSGADTLVRPWVESTISDADLYQVAMIFVSKQPSIFRVYLQGFIMRFIRADKKSSDRLLSDLLRELVANTPRREHEDLTFELRKCIEKVKSHPTLNRLHSIIINVLSKSDMAVEMIIEIERQYWKTQETAIQYPTPPETFLTFLKPLMADITIPSNLPSRIAVNQLPYAEATFMRIFQFASQVVRQLPSTDKKRRLPEIELIKLTQDSWDPKQIVHALKHNDIEVAIYNAYLKKGCDVGHEDEIEPSERLLAWTGYEALISTKFLYGLTGKSKTSNAFQNTITQLFQRHKFFSESDILDNKQIFAQILKEARIVTYQSTDIGRRFKVFLDSGGFASTYAIQSADDNEGLKLILDGKVDVFFGGVIQAEYARRTYPGRVRPFFKTADEPKASTICHFWALRESVKENPGLKPDLFTGLSILWNLVNPIWAYLQEEHSVEQTRDFVRKFRKYLLVALNLDFLHNEVQGFVENFKDLADIINSHNKLAPKLVAEAEDPILVPLIINRLLRTTSNGARNN